jgi:hypothetical protein
MSNDRLLAHLIYSCHLHYRRIDFTMHIHSESYRTVNKYMSKNAALSTSLGACSWLYHCRGHTLQPTLYHNPVWDVALENMTQTLYSNPDLKLPAECDPPNVTDDGKCKAVPYFVNVLRENILFTIENILKSIADFLSDYKVQSSLSNW